MFVDEFGSNLAMTKAYARSPMGQPAIEAIPSKQGENLSVVAALTVGGVKAEMALSGSIDGIAFETWVALVLVPILLPGQTVFMDNARSHKGDKVRILIEQAGCSLVFLPAYSPDLNPIEGAFSKIKGHLKRSKARTTQALLDAIANAITLVSASHAQAWIAHAGYKLSRQ